MTLRTIESLGLLTGKRVIVRCDLNVPLKDGEITDDGRVRASLPTIKALLEQGARVVIVSHLGRPKGAPEEKYSLAPVAVRLAQLLGHDVAFATDTREDILRACDVFLDNGIFIETGPHKHAIQQTFFLYVWEPGGHRIELCNSGARMTLAPDSDVITWTEAERRKGQAWGLKTIDSFHTHGTPAVPEGAS